MANKSRDARLEWILFSCKQASAAPKRYSIGVSEAAHSRRADVLGAQQYVFGDCAGNAADAAARRRDDV